MKQVHEDNIKKQKAWSPFQKLVESVFKAGFTAVALLSPYLFMVRVLEYFCWQSCITHPAKPRVGKLSPFPYG